MELKLLISVNWDQPCRYDLGRLKVLQAAQAGIILGGLKFDFGYFWRLILIAIFAINFDCNIWELKQEVLD